METSGFFTSKIVDGKYDRSYTAEQFAQYFSTFIGNGIFAGGDALVVSTASDGMKVNVTAGKAWINGYWYENNSTAQVELNLANGTQDRIDAIVLRWSNTDRSISLAVKTGTPASSPVSPTLDRDADNYELCLAYVKVPKGTTVVQQSNITDTRLNADVCGIVGALVEQWDMSQYGAQLNAWFTEYKNTSQSEFTTWFNSMKGQLSEDAAGNLQVEIDALQTKITKTNADFEVMRREMDCLNGIREKGNLIDIDTLMGYVRAGEHHKYAIGDYFEDNGVQWAVAARNWYPAWAFGDGVSRPEHIVCMPVDFLATSYQFNTSNTNTGGYAGSLMPANMETEFGKLGSKVKAYCKQTRIFENNKGAWAATMRSMRLPTIVEVTGNQGWANEGFSSGVCSQLPLCQNSLFRIRSAWYWCLDPSSSDTTDFCRVVIGGHSGGHGASRSGRVRPIIVLA